MSFTFTGAALLDAVVPFIGPEPRGRIWLWQGNSREIKQALDPELNPPFTPGQCCAVCRRTDTLPLTDASCNGPATAVIT